MKKLAVHLHLYYKEQLPKIVKYLKNLDGVDYDLFVTMVEDDEQVKLKILAEFPNSKIWVVENRGYDIGPFIEFLHRIDLRDYEYVLKVHTKRLLNGEYCYFNKKRFSLASWTKILYESLLGTPQIVLNNINILNKNKKIGLLSSKYCIISEKLKFDVSKLRLDDVEMQQYTFVAGTMFYVKANLLEVFLKYKLDDFSVCDSKIHDNTLAHYLERLLGQSVINNGYDIYGVKYKSYYLESLIASVTRFLYHKTITKKGNILIKIFRLPVFRKKIVCDVKESICKKFSVCVCKNKRLAVYAAFKKNGKIDEADVFYLKELKKVCDNIIYVADCDLCLKDLAKIEEYVCFVLAKHHGEYDFGSYKRGFQIAKDNKLLEGVEELVFCNDSCYAPFSSFEQMFDKMSRLNNDFWGITENVEFSRHIQSYFLVFRSQVFDSKVFNEFICSISAKKTVFEVIQNYEIGLSNLLFDSGFRGGAYIPYPESGVYPLTIIKGFTNLTAAPIWLLKQGAPIIKKKAFIQSIANYEGVFKLKKYASKLNSDADKILPSNIFCIRYQSCLYMFKVIRFFFQKKITSNGKMLIKICKIPVYSKKVA